MFREFGLALGNYVDDECIFHMIRRRLGPIHRVRGFPNYRVTGGESSQYTLP